jgi:hypothetical protein
MVTTTAKWLGVLGLGAFSLVAQAQVVGTSGKVILGTDIETCLKNHCSYDIEVTVTDAVAGTCDAKFTIYKIIIPKGQHDTKLTWKIKKQSGDSGKYEFTESGIAPHADSGNDPNLDLDNGGFDADGKHTFTWTSRNKRAAEKPIAYDIYIRRTAPGGKPLAICESKDPVVVNSGN